MILRDGEMPDRRVDLVRRILRGERGGVARVRRPRTESPVAAEGTAHIK